MRPKRCLVFSRDDLKTGGETTASPKIWEDMNGFKAAMAKWGADAKAAQTSVKDIDSFKTAFGAAGKQCGACHEVFPRLEISVRRFC